MPTIIPAPRRPLRFGEQLDLFLASRLPVAAAPFAVVPIGTFSCANEGSAVYLTDPPVRLP